MKNKTLPEKQNKILENRNSLRYRINRKSSDNLNEKDKLFLYEFLLYCLEQKKLIKTKDVIYDKVNGIITSIPSLLYTPTSAKKFTLKRCEKRPSILSSLAPKSKVNRKSAAITEKLNQIKNNI